MHMISTINRAETIFQAIILNDESSAINAKYEGKVVHAIGVLQKIVRTAPNLRMTGTACCRFWPGHAYAVELILHVAGRRGA
jgi:hypothetical protein